MADRTGTPTENAAPSEEVAAWLSEIESARKDLDAWRTRCDKVRKAYRYDNSRSVRRRKFQIFWSNIETMKPAVYAKTPKAVVDSRYRTQDSVARVASMLLERTIQFQFDVNDYDRTFKQVRDDYLLYARGVPRLRYEAVFDEAEIDDGLDEDAVEGPQAEALAEVEGVQPTEILSFENLHCDYVHREDLIHPKARTWEELPWLAYRAFLTRKELIKRFGDKVGKTIPLQGAQPRDDTDRKPGDSATDKAIIYEIWDKANDRVLWVAEGFQTVLEESAPYLKVTGFFPSPRPAYGTLTNDSLEPIPDFIYYQDQTEEINELTARIGALTDALKLVGFYAAGPQGEGTPEIERALTPGVENRMIAVKAYDAFAEKGKGGAPIIWLPVDMVEKIITACVQLRKQLIEDVHQITGVSDIMRGDTDPDETAKAQGLKAQFGSTRMQDRKKELARVARDICVMAGEVISEQFQLSTMLEIANIKLPTRADVAMAQQQARLQFSQIQQSYQAAAAQAQQQGQQPPPPPQPPQMPNMGPTQEDVEGFLRNGVTRRFRLDIETDSTVAADQVQEQQSRVAFIKEMSAFVTAWGPILQEKPELAPLAAQLLLFGVRAFPVARELESIIEEVAEKMVQQASQPKPPPQPSPDEMVKLQTAKIKGQAEAQKAQTETYTAQVQAQAEQQKAQLDATAAARQHMMDTQAAAAEHAMKMRTMDQTMQMAEQKFNAQQALALLKPVPGQM